VTAIAIGIVVVVIPIGATATDDDAIRTCCRCRHVWAPIGGVIVHDDAGVADAPAAPLLLLSGATDPTAAALTKTRYGTVAATATATAATATATEEEECDGCNGADRRRRLDDSLLRLEDGILLRLITATMAQPESGDRDTSMPAIDIGALFIGREDWEGDNGSDITTEDDDDTDAEAGGVGARFLGGRPRPTLGGAFREDEDGNEDDGDEQGQQARRRRLDVVDVRDAL